VYPYIIPHLKDRPLSLHVKHNGPNAPGLYIKDMEGRGPEWLQTFSVSRKHKKKGRRDIIDYLLCNDEATLQYVVNLGCIDINPWTSRAGSADTPDFIIVDLDPSDKDFTKAIEAAKAAKKIFDKNKIIAFPKTSGKTGIHLYIPCNGFGFPEARKIAENICDAIHDLVPSITTTDVSINNRGDKLYLDPNQNDFADTVAAPYSLRPYHKPTVSTPIEWKEINNKLDPGNFTITTILDRLKKKGDLFKGVLDKKIADSNNRRLRMLL
jgi:bifunctional non-homologous end joining protein LigD